MAASLVAAAVGTMVGCSLVMGEIPAEDRAGLTEDAGDSGVRDSSKWDTSSEPDADAAEAAVEDAKPEVGPCADGAPEQRFFPDDDGDGHGDKTTTGTLGCEPPDSGVWVTNNDDCQDDDARVFGGQPNFFGDRPYLRDDGNYSYDFDCDDIEEPAPNQLHAPSACAGFLCGAKGFVETPERPGVGIRNRYCGSNVIRECVILTCTPVEMTTEQFFVCK